MEGSSSLLNVEGNVDGDGGLSASKVAFSSDGLDDGSSSSNVAFSMDAYAVDGEDGVVCGGGGREVSFRICFHKYTT